MLKNFKFVFWNYYWKNIFFFVLVVFIFWFLENIFILFFCLFFIELNIDVFFLELLIFGNSWIGIMLLLFCLYLFMFIRVGLLLLYFFGL